MLDVLELLNSLDINVKVIDISRRGLTKLPDLSRFKKLKTLYCQHNELTSLNSLIHHELIELNCSYNKLTSLPDLNVLTLDCRNNQLTSLPPFINLIELFCSNNQLTSLPTFGLNNIEILNISNNKLTYLSCLALNDKLRLLDCSHNELTYLPHFNDNLKNIWCSNNQLNFLPTSLLDKKIFIDIHNNPINKIFVNVDIGTIKINSFLTPTYNLDRPHIYTLMNKWNHFREFYFLSKLQKKIISWMWKSRETKIKEQFHPKHLHHFLEKNNISQDDGEEMDKFLNLDKWD